MVIYFNGPETAKDKSPSGFARGTFSLRHAETLDRPMHVHRASSSRENDSFWHRLNRFPSNGTRIHVPSFPRTRKEVRVEFRLTFLSFATRKRGEEMFRFVEPNRTVRLKRYTSMAGEIFRFFFFFRSSGITLRRKFADESSQAG